MSQLFTEPRWLSAKYYKYTDDEVRIIAANADAGLRRCLDEDPRGLRVDVRDRLRMYQGLARECQEELDYRNRYDKAVAKNV